MKLTLAIPIYNGRAFITKLLSNIEETYNGNFKVLIRENHSQNNIQDLIGNYSFPINYKKHDTNIGFDANIYSLINDCDTEYIWFMGCDDNMFKGADETILRYIENFKSGGYIANWKSFNEEGEELSSRGIQYSESFCTQSIQEFSIKLGAQFFLSSIILNKGLLKDENYELYQGPEGFYHWYLFLKASAKGGAGFINETIIKHVTGNESYSKKWIELFFINYPAFVNKYVSDYKTRRIFINQNLNFSMTLNFLHKRALYGSLEKEKIRRIFLLLKGYSKFYIFILIPLILNSNICRFLMYLKIRVKKLI
jgi:hypothetical protein